MKTVFCALMLINAVILAHAQEKSLPLYPGGVPNAKPIPKTYIEKIDKDWIYKVTAPTIIRYLPEKGLANGTSIIIFP
jgi:hypothetical protein